MLINHLDRTFTLGFEKEEKKMRLVILDKDQELACRRESVKKLKDFINEENAIIFKGRVQLVKENEEIRINFKNKTIGTLTRDDFSVAIGLRLD